MQAICADKLIKLMNTVNFFEFLRYYELFLFDSVKVQQTVVDIIARACPATMLEEQVTFNRIIPENNWY